MEQELKLAMKLSPKGIEALDKLFADFLKDYRKDDNIHRLLLAEYYIQHKRWIHHSKKIGGFLWFSKAQCKALNVVAREQWEKNTEGIFRKEECEIMLLIWRETDRFVREIKPQKDDYEVYICESTTARHLQD